MIRFRLRCAAFASIAMSLNLAGCGASKPVVLTQPPAQSWADTGLTASNAVPDYPDTLRLENIPQQDPGIAAALTAYSALRPSIFMGFSGEGVLFTRREGETVQLFMADAPGNDPQQVSFETEPVGPAVPSPTESHRIAFMKDAGGGEGYQIYLLDPPDTQTQALARRVSDGQGRKSWPTWSNDGSRLAWVTTLEGSQRAIRVSGLEPGEAPQTVLTRDGSWFPVAWSPDNTQLLLYEFRTLRDSRVHLLDVASGAVTQVNPIGEPVGYGRLAFASDGQSLLIVSNQDSDMQTLYNYDIATERMTPLTPDIDHEIEFVTADRCGRHYAFVVNRDGESVLEIRDGATGSVVDVPALPPGVVTGLAFKPDCRALGLTHNGATSPGRVLVLSLPESDKDAAPVWEEWSPSNNTELSFVSPDFFRYETFDLEDGSPRTIPAFIYSSPTPGPRLVVISMHGGPSDQARPGFNSQFQFWANELGLSVIVPNVRGSTGFGATFETLDNGRLREDSVKDVGALLDWIETQPELDPSCVAITGGSYGGYMVLASLIHFSDRLAGGIDIVGISDFVTFLESTAEHRRDLRRPEYGDERDPKMRAFLKAISPLTRAAEIDRPLFVVQGANDPRVPVSEARQIVEAVRAAGGDVWYMEASDEGHGFRKSANMKALDIASAQFLLSLNCRESRPAD